MYISPAHCQWVRNLNLIFINQSSRCKICQVETFSVHFPVDDMKRPYLPGKDIHLALKTRTHHLPSLLSLTETDQPLSRSSETSNQDMDWGAFDDYGTAPILCGKVLLLFDVWTFDASGVQALPNFASTWNDRGYRLLPYFAKVSQKQDPTNFISHLLPTMDDTQRSTGCDPSPSSVTHHN
jgi:hypothetical protein